jgi:hypothetical protein
MTPTTNVGALREAPEPTHPCIRCGREGVPAEDALCELCNPLELAQPSATQVHGIAMLGILAFIVLLALAGRAALAGTGPFQGSIDGVAAASGGLNVTITIANQGTKAAATTCQIALGANPAIETHQVVQTPVVPAGGQIQFTALVTNFGTEVVPLTADCQSP